MKSLTAKQVLQLLIEILIESLKELEEVPLTEFTYGEKTAYVECLEWISRWRGAKKYGVDDNVEKRFPLVGVPRSF